MKTYNYMSLMTTQDYVISAMIVAIIVWLAWENFKRVERKKHNNK